MQIHVEISYVHGLGHLCQRNFSYKGKGRSHQTSSWELSLEWSIIMASLSETLALYILQPFNQLLQNSSGPPGAKRHLKRSRTHSSSNVLVHYDPSLPVILENDASQYGIGAVIFHRFPNGDERPNAYATRSLNLFEKNYSQIEKEGFAIIFGVTKFYLYLFGRKFTAANWSQTPVENICSGFCNSSFACC